MLRNSKPHIIPLSVGQSVCHILLYKSSVSLASLLLPNTLLSSNTALGHLHATGVACINTIGDIGIWVAFGGVNDGDLVVLGGGWAS